MRASNESHGRRTRRFFARYVVVMVLGAFAVVVSVSIRRLLTPLPYRQTVVVTGEPVYVLSIDAKRHRVTGLSLSSDTVIRGAHGVGKYSLGSLVSLDAIDKRDGRLVTSSVSLSLGIPVTDVIIDTGVGDRGEMTVTSLRRIFSVRRKPKTTGWIAWLRLVRVMWALPVDALRVIDVSSAITTQVIPDGSMVPKVDESRIDSLLDNEFFDTDIRQESVSIAVYNTTQVPQVAQEVARQLARMGAKLVFVGNKEPGISRCRLLGDRSLLTSHAATFIRGTYGCSAYVDADRGKEIGADIIVELGEEEASRYK
ncbi:MAG TPA: hypothetical protein VJB96_04280 [Patescibacteria group bacterium]|nr:hypothetical protein [Patescibacteria group bacterium]